MKPVFSLIANYCGQIILNNCTINQLEGEGQGEELGTGASTKDVNYSIFRSFVYSL